MSPLIYSNLIKLLLYPAKFSLPLHSVLREIFSPLAAKLRIDTTFIFLNARLVYYSELMRAFSHKNKHENVIISTNRREESPSALRHYHKRNLILNRE